MNYDGEKGTSPFYFRYLVIKKIIFDTMGVMFAQMKYEHAISFFTPAMENILVDNPLNNGTVDQGHHKPKNVSHTLIIRDYRI